MDEYSRSIFTTLTYIVYRLYLKKIMVNKLKIKLKQVNYQFKEDSNKLTVKLDYGLTCEIIFLEDKTTIIIGRFKGWNFLTGALPFTIKGSILYSTFWIAFMMFLQLFYRTQEFLDLAYLPYLILLYVLIWQLFYIVKFFTFKITIENWITK